MSGEHLLDVRALEPCEPLERILAALPGLRAGDYLHVLHRMEPHPLYALLAQQGYAWRSRAGTDGVPLEIFIWRAADAQAAQALRAALDDAAAA